MIDSRTGLLLVMPLFAWFAVAMTTFIERPAAAFLYLVVVALPSVVFAADRMATHAVHWVTAGIHVDIETVRSCRDGLGQSVSRQFHPDRLGPIDRQKSRGADPPRD